MTIDMNSVGYQIQSLRKKKGLTQTQLGEKLNVSFQAVSKWERGECLPDIQTLSDLAEVLDTIIDNILSGGQRRVNPKGNKTMDEIKQGVNCLITMGNCLGKENLIYRCAVDGISEKLNMELESYLSNPSTYEAVVAEAAIQCILSGYYIDEKDIQRSFISSHFAMVVNEYAKKQLES